MRIKGSALMGCLLLAGAGFAQGATFLNGVVMADAPLTNAKVTVIDKWGKQKTALTDRKGHWRLEASTLTPPLLVSATDLTSRDGHITQNCRYNDKPRTRCMASVVTALPHNGNTTVNITPLTDRIVSEIAQKLGYIGPQQWVESGNAGQMREEFLTAPLNAMRAGLSQALTQAGVSHVDRYNPITTPLRDDGKGAAAVLQVINHNRGYHNDSGEASGTILTDIRFRPIVGFSDVSTTHDTSGYEPFDYLRAKRELEAIKNAKVRILIVSDSTAASYEESRLPRMGWGQVFQERFRDDSGVAVLNGARAGRSSRDFYNEGWYQQMARFMKAGDYVFIAHGHNDQNCNSAKPVRGAADVKNLCTYPNDSNGNKQYPEGQPQLSFQNSLERYIALARRQGARPIIMTPTTRVMTAERKPAFENGDTTPVGSSHWTKQNRENGYAYVGDYAATIRKTAADNRIPFIDLERKTIDFVNQHRNDWKSYWLAVDPNDPRYPYYKTQTSGTLDNPDRTHFQQKGAEAVAGIVAEGIAQQPALVELAAKLK
ncbi:GDSL-type esterase/lipase family protein [Pseudomonas sp. WAC2]|uniref:GDSL-type esterase/lipase family protein n=1 Tax=Pseudomonas sp. WAC2 TaxID=3055057 RepID=UPI0025AEE854|nr:GDSL-type esterase/lipase family protein [Pseudomonas sp. WAC2]MDN3238015.1 GDSL-type esterase/lipase family protein [Pseudomonas sp. WAC2]